MAGAGGPISTLPGSTLSLSVGSMCDDHPEVLAVVRIQGETDSFGHEYLDMCEECYQNYLVALKQKSEEERECDWCKQLSKQLRPTRDYDEGMSGPVYDVCPACRKRQHDDAQAELEDYDPHFYGYRD